MPWLQQHRELWDGIYVGTALGIFSKSHDVFCRNLGALRKEGEYRCINSRQVCFSACLPPSPPPPLASASWVLESQACTTTSGSLEPLSKTPLSFDIATLGHQVSSKIPVEKCSFQSLAFSVCLHGLCESGDLVAVCSMYKMLWLWF